MWVRTRIEPDAGVGMDTDRLVNLAHYRSVAVAARTESPAAPAAGVSAVSGEFPSALVARRWDVVAYLAPGQSVAGIAGAPEVLAALPTELEARATLSRLMEGLARGAGGIDLNDFAWPNPPTLADAAEPRDRVETVGANDPESTEAPISAS